MNSRQNAVRSRFGPFCPFLCSAFLVILGLGGCARWDRPALQVQETPPPDLLGAKDIDPAMRERIERAIGRNAD
ncbi:hypothetical protein [Bradyrhizobium sp. NAS96.2]|uniref:hypothetical protein n=1 Tax=Bradyrhizobium sp. NAS96.2 TaxID=1680160 RepID=UPI0011610B7E|nr:hypothetical protein [Bradyrhizobium sp. NAS96.2]